VVKTDNVIEGLSPELKHELAQRVLARRSLLAYTKKFYPQYKAGWVHEDVCRRLEKFAQDVVDQKSPRLALFMPPRIGKSELASIRFPAWYLGHNPDHEIINSGYSLDLPMKFSRKVREQLRDPGYQALFSKTILDPESQSAEAWNTTMGGGYMAAGVGGGLTGKGAHVLIIDDPVKNMEEADSQVQRDTVWDWYWSTAYTRLAPGGGVLLIQTRWNDDDLGGRLFKAMHEDLEADQFDVVTYPAMAEEWEYRIPSTQRTLRAKEPLDPAHHLILTAHRAHCVQNDKVACPVQIPNEDLEIVRMPGEVLHPERFTVGMVQRIKNNQPPRVWSALYQQNPVPDEGIYFRKEYFRYEPVPPEHYGRNVYQAWDFAIGEKQQNDYTVGVTLVQDERDFLHVVEVVRFKGDSFTIVEEILDAAQRWGSEATAPLTLGFEDSQIWKSIKPLLQKRMAERGIYPPFEELRPLTDKMARARALQGRMQQGRVYFPAEASWRAEVEKELLRFPAGAHDDIVDAMAWAVNLCVGKAPRTLKKPKPIKSWRDKIAAMSRDGVGHMAS
jgi:predicted phage terminase large subunit-like protein